MLLSHFNYLRALACGFQIRIPWARAIVDRHRLAKEIISSWCFAIQKLTVMIAESNNSIEYRFHFHDKFGRESVVQGLTMAHICSVS